MCVYFPLQLGHAYAYTSSHIPWSVAQRRKRWQHALGQPRVEWQRQQPHAHTHWEEVAVADSTRVAAHAGQQPQRTAACTEVASHGTVVGVGKHIGGWAVGAVVLAW